MGQKPQPIQSAKPKDWSQEIDLDGLWNPALFPGSGSSSIVKGQVFANAMDINGLVTRIVLMTNGLIRVEVRQSALPGWPAEKLAQYPLRYILITIAGVTTQVSE